MMTSEEDHNNIIFEAPAPPEDWERRPKQRGYAFDPEDAHDHDDAIYVEELEDGAILAQIHIADPAAYLRDKPEIIQTAVERVKTQFREDVEHMLGKDWAEFLSLNCEEDEYKASITFQVIFNPDGSPRSEIEIFKSKVHATHIPIQEEQPLPKVPNKKLYEKTTLFLFRLMNEQSISKKVLKGDREMYAHKVVEAFNAFANYATNQVFEGELGYPVIARANNRAPSSSPIRESTALFNHLLIALAFDTNEQSEDRAELEELRAKVLENNLPFDEARRAQRRARKKRKKTESASALNAAGYLNTLDCTNLTGAEIDSTLGKISPSNIARLEPESVREFMSAIERNIDTFNLYKYWPVVFVLIRTFDQESPLDDNVARLLIKYPSRATAGLMQIRKYNIEMPQKSRIEMVQPETKKTYEDFCILLECMFGPPTYVGKVWFLNRPNRPTREMKGVMKDNRLSFEKKGKHWELILSEDEGQHTLARVTNFPEEKNSTDKKTAVKAIIDKLLADSHMQLWPNAPIGVTAITVNAEPIEFRWED